MKRKIVIGLLAILVVVLTTTNSNAQERIKRSIGPANFYISIKDQIKVTKEQEEKLLNIEQGAQKKLEEISTVVTKAQQSLSALTREEDVDLIKAKELLKNIAALESDMKFTILETITLENKVLSKDQREKANNIAKEMSKGQQRPPTQTPPPAPPAKK